MCSFHQSFLLVVRYAVIANINSLSTLLPVGLPLRQGCAAICTRTRVGGCIIWLRTGCTAGPETIDMVRFPNAGPHARRKIPGTKIVLRVGMTSFERALKGLLI